MSYVLAIILAKVIFVALLIALKVKAFTLHYCLAGKIYWRFDRQVSKPNGTDTLYTIHAGPISFAWVR